MWAIRRKRNAIRPGEIRKDIMEEETSDTGLKAEAKIQTARTLHKTG